ncbi:MAG: hypothetical protein B6I38_09385 [Anaerolineaceae bacterium 4572_5.1]|nr:MAG: hypothetical protein B6I38_09385 [Anaerolineaceae bacterium 4572_5.1]
MNHQPFETWILLETKLTPAQNRELLNHLRTCPQCRRLAQSTREITHLFKTTPTPYPLPGFTTRWKRRLNQKEQGKKNLITWVTLSALTLTVILTMISFSTQIPSLSEHFPQLLTAFISLTTRWITFITSLQNIFSPLFRVGIKLIPSTWIFAFAISLSGITIAWLVTLSKSNSFFIRR